MSLAVLYFQYFISSHAETSKRGTTKKRISIQHKATESRKKAKKTAKKNTQWKSSAPFFVIPMLSCH
jgi:hypothetical protein